MDSGRSRLLIALCTGAILLGGCAEPVSMTVATTIASYSFDGISYASQGKSVGDMAISQVADEDCALLRVFTDKPICHDYTLEQRRDMAVALVEANRYDRRATGVSDPDLYAPPKPPNPIFEELAQEAQARLDEARRKTADYAEIASLKADTEDLLPPANHEEPSAQTQASARTRSAGQRTGAARPILGDDRRMKSLPGARPDASEWHGIDQAAAVQPRAQTSEDRDEQAWLPI